ncbi:hypothetical protein D9M68_654490 [compost metagenome]
MIVIGALVTLFSLFTVNTKTLSCISMVADCGTRMASLCLIPKRTLPVFPERKVPFALGKVARSVMAPVFLSNWPSTISIFPV